MRLRNELSLAYLTVQGAHPVDQIEAAAAAGLDAAGLRLVAPLGVPQPHPIAGSPATIREIRSACRRTGISLLDGEVLTLSPATDVAAWVPALETAAELGMRFMQLTSEDPEHARAVENFGSACDAAARLGVRVAVEFMRWRSVRTIEAALRLVEEAGRENGGIVVDALHLSRSGGTPRAVAAVPASRLLYLQLCDARAGTPADHEVVEEARGGRLQPGEGSLWLDELLDALPPGIPISIEVPRAGDAARTAVERAVEAADATRAFLARHRGPRA